MAILVFLLDVLMDLNGQIKSDWLQLGLPINPYVKTNWKLISKKCGQNGHHLVQDRPTATLACDLRLLMGITRSFFIRFWHYFFENCLFFRDETNCDKIKALSPLFYIFGHTDPKPPSKGWDVSWPSPSTHISKSRFPKWEAWPPSRLTFVSTLGKICTPEYFNFEPL